MTALRVPHRLPASGRRELDPLPGTNELRPGARKSGTATRHSRTGPLATRQADVERFSPSWTP